MLPLTQRRPKPLVPVLDRPMIEHIICGARDAGFDHLCLVVGYLGDMIRDCLGDGSRLGVKLEYIWQEVAGGTGAATLLAENFIAGEPFFLSWGDIVVGPQTYQNVARAWHEEHPDAILSLNYVEDPWEGAAVYVEDGFITHIVEKPPRGTATTHYNNAGIFIFGPELMEILKETPDSQRGEKEVPDAIQTLLSRGARIRGLEVEGYWSDVARPATVLQLNGTMIESADPTHLMIDPSAVVSPQAHLTGPLYIGPGCQIGAAEIGPEVALMSGTAVADGACVKHCMTFGGNHIGADCELDCAVLEEGVSLPAQTGVQGSAAAPAVIHKAAASQRPH